MKICFTLDDANNVVRIDEAEPAALMGCARAAVARAAAAYEAAKAVDADQAILARAADRMFQHDAVKRRVGTNTGGAHGH